MIVWKGKGTDGTSEVVYVYYHDRGTILSETYLLDKSKHTGCKKGVIETITHL